MVTNIPAPYREPIHERVWQKLGGYRVIYCRDREPNREWQFRPGNYPRHFLKPRMVGLGDRHVHVNSDIWRLLNRLNPNVVITAGFNPTHLIAFFWSIYRRRHHVCMTDGWLYTEQSLTLFHRLLRKAVYKNSTAFIGAGKHSLDLYRHYGCPDSSLFQSHLCVDNDRFFASSHLEKEFDLLFSGQFIERKLPFFFCEVAHLVKKLRGRCTALIIGSGPLKERFLNQLEEMGIEFQYGGFAHQDRLPALYGACKVFLFPTRSDPWGIVANEACAAGVPVLTCEHSGAAGDLILHNETGFVFPLEPHLWAQTVVSLIEEPDLYHRISMNAVRHARKYNFDSAAHGILAALEHVSGDRVAA